MATFESDDMRDVSFDGAAVTRRRPPPIHPALCFVPVSRPSTEAGAFAAWGLRQAALESSQRRERVFARRLPSCLRALKVTSLEAARERLEERPDLLPSILCTLLIGLTGFFRDEVVFGSFQAIVVPWMVRRGQPPRIWSAACSTGAELYSVAILLDEARMLEGATLVGTDCRADATDAARASVYGPPVTDTLPRRFVPEYFIAENGPQIRLVPRLRAAVSWKTADLFAAVEPGPWDVVLWRNAAIHLEAVAARRLYGHLAATLAPGGDLVTGKAERPPLEAGLVRAGRCLYRKPGGPDAR